MTIGVVERFFFELWFFMSKTWTRGRHRWNFGRYPVPIGTQKNFSGQYPVPIGTQNIFLAGTQYPKSFVWLLPGTNRYPQFFIWPVPGTHRYSKKCFWLVSGTHRYPYKRINFKRIPGYFDVQVLKFNRKKHNFIFEYLANWFFEPFQNWILYRRVAAWRVNSASVC